MIISLIAAMTENRVIGRDNSIPWNQPADLKRFKEITMGHPLIMGRKTYESIGRPLPGRKTIIISRKQDYRAEGCVVRHSLQDALADCAGEQEVFICGGSEVYLQTLPLASRIYLTIIHREVDGDARFPMIPEDFVEVRRDEVMEDKITCSFIVYERIDT